MSGRENYMTRCTFISSFPKRIVTLASSAAAARHRLSGVSTPRSSSGVLACRGPGRDAAKLSLLENTDAEPTVFHLVVSTNFGVNEHLITNCLYTPTHAVTQCCIQLIYKHPVNLDARSRSLQQ